MTVLNQKNETKAMGQGQKGLRKLEQKDARGRKRKFFLIFPFILFPLTFSVVVAVVQRHSRPTAFLELALQSS